MHQTPTNQSPRIKFMSRIKKILRHDLFAHFEGAINAIYEPNPTNKVKTAPQTEEIAINEAQFIKAPIAASLAITQDTHTPNAHLERAALTSTLIAGPSQQYLLYIIKTMYEQKRFTTPEGLREKIKEAMILESVEELELISPGKKQNSIANVHAIIKKYPITLCCSTLNMTWMTDAIAPCTEIFIAANIKIICDDPMPTGVSNEVQVQEPDNDWNVTNKPLSRVISDINDAHIARERYVTCYLSYLHMWHSIFMGASSLHTDISPQHPALSRAITYVLPFLELPEPHPEIANGVIHKSERLRIGGELHNLMVTSTISKWHTDSELDPSLEDSARWECVQFALNEMMKLKHNTTNTSRNASQ